MNNLHPLITDGFRKFQTSPDSAAEETTNVWELILQNPLDIVHIARR
jgi:hypothetical protein